MGTLEKEILEFATHKSGSEFNNIIDLMLKKTSDNRLKAVIAKKKEEIKAAKTEAEQATKRLELKRTLKEYLRSEEVKEYCRVGDTLQYKVA